MCKRSRSGRILHARRPFAERRALHITTRVRRGGPELRRPEVRAILSELLRGARERGLGPAIAVVMPNHLHLVVVPRSRRGLRDGTRYLFGQLARRLNSLEGRSRGKVFDDRYWSTRCATVRHGFDAAGYVLRNPTTAGMRPRKGRPDPYTWVDDETIGASSFLCSILGATPAQRAALMARMTEGRVPFLSVPLRFQAQLPGV